MPLCRSARTNVRTFVRIAFPSTCHNSQDDITRSHFKTAVFHPLSEKLYHREKTLDENIRKSGATSSEQKRSMLGDSGVNRG